MGQYVSQKYKNPAEIIKSKSTFLVFLIVVWFENYGIIL